MHIRVDAIHRKALEVVARYRSCEADLIDILQQADCARVCYALGYNSLYQYCVEGLGLSEDVAYSFISLARKSVEVPALKNDIRTGKITVSKAKRIVPVLNKSNQAHWLGLAKTVTKRELERAVVSEKPELAVREKVKFVQAERVHIQFGASPELAKKLERAKDIESQKKGRPESLENAVAVMAEMYLQKEDPIERAKRNFQRGLAKSTGSARISDDANLNSLGPGPANVHGAAKASGASSGSHTEAPMPNSQKHRRPLISSAVRHHLQLKFNGQCAHIDDQGKRCNERRFLHIHHIKALNEGGDHSIHNLQLLCAGHHQAHHHHH